MEGFLKKTAQKLALTANSILWLGVSLSPMIGGLCGTSYWKNKEENVLEDLKSTSQYVQYRSDEDERLNNYYDNFIKPAQEELAKGDIEQNQFNALVEDYQTQFDESHDLGKAIYKVGTENQIKQFEHIQKMEKISDSVHLLSPLALAIGLTGGVATFLSLSTAFYFKNESKNEENEENMQ